MILEFDLGNSRIKWRRYDETGGVTIDLGFAADAEAVIHGELNHCEPRMVRLCSVRLDSASKQLQEWAHRRWGLTAAVARVTRECGGVSNRYADLGKLGIDRWLAMLAAFRRTGGACVVVDAGTAVTIDAVDGLGQHLGGYILPGIRLSTAALEDNTGIRLEARQPSGDTGLGHSTDEAVYHGIIAAIISLISATLDAVARPGDPVGLFFSGGDAELIRKSGEFDSAEIVPELVLDGLAIACPAPGDKDGERQSSRVD